LNIISTITLCDVDITPTNQLSFINQQAQFNYFASKAVQTIAKCKYQARTAKIRIRGYVDSLINCNYGYYTNSYNGVSKTFYFWIVSKNLVARNTTELTIQIDVIQTWYFSAEYRPCFIEREHVYNDAIGANTIPEDFELGDYITYLRKPVDALIGDPCFIVGVTDTSDGEIGGIYGKTYSGFILKYFSYNDTDKLNTYITNMCKNGKGDAIAFIFTFPSTLLASYNLVSGDSIPSWQGVLTTATITLTWAEMVKNFNFNLYNYTPFNNKLYTYPYNFVTIKNTSGSNVVLKTELFDNYQLLQFTLNTVLTQHPIINLVPREYSGKDFAIDDSITLDDYGLCSWNNDNYSNWFAQHTNSITTQSSNANISMQAKGKVIDNNYNNALDNRNTTAVKGAFNTAMGSIGSLASGNIGGAISGGISGGVNTALNYGQTTENANNDLSNSNLMNTTDYQNTIASINASVRDAQVQPNTAKGSTNQCGLDMARNTATFYIEQNGIKPEYARIVDTHWQMFGYKVNRMGTPYLNSRQKWNYIKTVGCNITGEIPHEDIDEMQHIFDNGITIWHDESYMYNYNTANPLAT